MRLSNGEIIYTDPLNWDTDGDGIRDGDEIVRGGFGSIHGVLNDDGSYTFYSDYGMTFYMKSDPNMSDSDGDGISDKDDTAPFLKGLDGGIVGALKIYSYGDGPNSSGTFSGHAFLAYTSFINDSTTLYGIKVNSEDEVAKDGDSRSTRPSYHNIIFTPNTVVTISTWAIWLPDELKGTWINNDYMYFKDNVENNVYSLTRYITSDQLEKMSLLTKEYSCWSEIYNCSAFATDIWNNVTEDNLSARGNLIFRNPDSLSYNIQQREDYKIGDPLLAKNHKTNSLKGIFINA